MGWSGTPQYNGKNWLGMIENSRIDWKWPEKARAGKNWLEIAGNGRNSWKWLKVDANDNNDACRDAKMYQRANNVGVKNPIWGKISAKFYTVLSGK